MALASTWFDGSGGTSYTDVRCDADFSAASTITTTSGSYQSVTRGPCVWLVFLPNKMNGNTDLNTKNPEYGYAYALKDSDSTEVGIPYVWHSLRPGPAVSGETEELLHRPFGYNTTSGTLLRAVLPTGGSDTCSVYVYQPHCWYGLVGQVIAAAMLSKGVDEDYLDQTAFSASDDAQIAMSASSDERPYIFFRRSINQQLGDSIKAMVANCWDILTINMDGKIALMPRTSVPAGYTIAGLDQSDGVVHVTYRYAYNRLVNHCWASEGRYYQVQFTQVGTFNNVVSSCVELAYPRTAHDRTGLPFEEFEDTTSATKYGLRELGRDAEIQEGNEVKKIRQYHLEHLCNIEGTPDGDPVEAKRVLMARLEDVESVLRREVTVVQDLRGLDYDVGYLVEDLEVTRDGATFDAFCIKKTINFNDLSVTSVFLEEPS